MDPLSLGMGAVAGFLLAALLFAGWVFSLARHKAALEARIEAERAGMENNFKALAQETLKSNAADFLTLAQEKMAQTHLHSVHDFDKRQKAISDLVLPVSKTLEQMQDKLHGLEKERVGAYSELREHLKIMAEDQTRLRAETARLTGALRNPAAQGKWGEFVLEGLLEKASLIKGQHYDTQTRLSDGRRPDVIIHLQDGFNIVVDAKTPINEFVDKMDMDLTSEEAAAVEQRLAGQVRSHVRQLGAKGYWEQLDGSPDFVVLFLPSEQAFSAALRADPSLVDFAAENQVVIASPTLMLSLLRVVGLSWRQVKMAKNARNIAELGAELYDRIAVFSGHMEKVGKGMESAMGAYNKALSSLESRVLVSARKFKDMKAASDTKDIVQIAPLESAVKTLSAKDLSGAEEERQEEKYG